jgi:hypothetical protein
MRDFLIVAGALALLAAACGDSSSDTTIPAALPTAPGASGFTNLVDNQYFPLPIGATWMYENVEDDTVERIDVTVTPDAKTVDGFEVVVVRDVVTVDGDLKEDTVDWYAQDSGGNVWYVGEDTAEYENGEVVSTAGAWEAGVDGAQAGIMMYADPAAHVGEAYYQEFYAGEAEDKAQVVRVGETVTVPAGTFENVIVIREWNPLEPGVVEEKYVAPGVGVVLEVVVEGGNERAELISYSTG